MKTKRWTLGVVLAAAVSLWGLIQADASPFSSYVLTDDLDNSVHGSAPEADSWGDESGSADEGSGSSGSDTSGGSATDGHDNNGHGNNADGVDSSNPGKGKGGPNGAVDEFCDGTGDCIDDEVQGGSSSSGSSSTSGSDGNNGNGNNADGVDSSNPSKGKGKVDQSCDGTGDCIDDEVQGGSSSSGSSSTSGKGKK